MKLATGAFICAMAMASTVSAATLSIVGGTDRQLPGNHDPSYVGLDPALVPSVGAGDFVKAFSDDGSEFEAFDGTNGLMLDKASKIRITFLASQANATNIVLNKAGGSLNNKTDTPGDFIDSLNAPMWVNLLFQTFDRTGVNFIGDIENNTGGQNDDGLSIAYFLENSKNALAFFGDGRGDTDHDDLVVRISILPLPASAILLLGALGGLWVLRRRKIT